MMLNWRSLAAFGLIGAGLVIVGCKSAPELSQSEAASLIQAKYDQTAPVGVNILVNDDGMRRGAVAKLWDRTKVYPNRLWADFKLTAEGKKAVVLPNGGDTIEWRPASLEDKNYSIVVTTTAANHMKIKEVGDPQDEMLPGADTAKVVKFTEAANLTGVPQTLQDIIAANPSNRISQRKEADFALANGAWTVKAIR